MKRFNVDQYNDGRAEHSDNDSSNNNMEVIFVGQSSSSTSNNNYMPMNAHAAALNNDVNSCKTLQRKLEMKVERAKRTFIQQYGGGGGDSIEPKQFEKTNHMMPINRLSIPRYQESVPLVEYKTEISDDDEVDSPFFPMKSKSMAKVDLSDTFSLQEMTINSDSGEESDDSQNLELLPPGVRKQYVNKFINYVCCFNARI